MDLGLDIAATGMLAEQVRQDQLSNDLANATTPGYKPDESPQRSFGEVLIANTEGGRPVGSVDLGVALGKTYTDMTPGSIQETGEPLDFAVEGSGFFAVSTPQGVRYTRDGQFTASAAGVLTDSAGNPVLGQGGAPVKVEAGGKVAAASSPGRPRARRPGPPARVPWRAPASMPPR
jgi:flagellar basal-body rod protein FlgF